MGFFRSKGIVLYKIKGKNTAEDIYSIFTLDYGKIKAIIKRKKTEKKLDYGYNIDFEIETKGVRDINKIKNIKILNEFKYQDIKFEVINSYLEILDIINKLIPDGLAIIEIYKIVEQINILENITSEKILLLKLKILFILGLISDEHKNITINKILKFINLSPINKIILLKGIDEKSIKILREIIYKKTF